MNCYNDTMPALDARLAMAASFVRYGTVPCDVGTDHAYLPIHLLTAGICPRAVATDIHKGPLDCARANAARYRCASRISFYQTDGISHVDLAAENVRDILICGMGGELIARILDDAPYTRLSDVRCILQPMSSVADLRQYLAGAGFRIEEERLAEAAGKIYTCMSVSYDGAVRTSSAAEFLLGAAHIRRGIAEPLFTEYLRRAAISTARRLYGRLEGGLDASEDESLLAELKMIAEREGVTIENL